MCPSHKIVAMLGLTALMLLAAAPVLAEYIEPRDVVIKTESYQPQVTDFPKGTYRYEVAWQGIPVAQAEIEVGDRQVQGQPFFRVEARAKTAGFVDVFYRLRHKSESIFDSSSLRPQKFSLWQRENSREKVREIQFNDSGLIRATSLSNGASAPPLEFQSENLTLDPISAAFVARSLPLKTGSELSFDVFNGKHRYLISFSVQGRESVTVGGKTYDAFRVKPTVTKLTDSEGEKRLESATLWVSADDSREVVKLESKVFVGRVSARLIGFTPGGAPQFLQAKLPASQATRRN